MFIPVSCYSCTNASYVESPQIGMPFQCGHCGASNEVASLPPPPPSPGITGEQIFLGILGVLGTGATLFLAYKGLQHMTDAWQGAGGDSLEYSTGFKARIKSAHVARNGLVCPRCGRRVRSYSQLHVDHKKTIKDGGEPWASNAQILCDECNLAKGGNSSGWEYATGR